MPARPGTTGDANNYYAIESHIANYCAVTDRRRTFAIAATGQIRGTAIKIINFPEFRQTSEFDCGAMAASAVLAYFGFDVSEGKIARIAGTRRWRGTPVGGFSKIAAEFGLQCRVRQMSIDEIKYCINKKQPIILRLQAWPGRKIDDWRSYWKSGHYVVAIGYDRDKIYFEDPYSIQRTFLRYKELELRWHDKDLLTKEVYENIGISFHGRKPDKKRIVYME